MEMLTVRRPTYCRCPNRADDHRDVTLIIFFFSSLLLPLKA
jgi:hypothetical protein